MRIVDTLCFLPIPLGYNKMTYRATTAEITLLFFLKNKSTHTALPKELEPLFQNTEQVQRAIEGCITKGFVTQNSNTFSLTEAGLNQI